MEIIIPISRPSKGAMGKTGLWRILTPTIDEGKCTLCFLCWLYCPEEAIDEGKEGFPEIDLEHCKGCGVCAVECPVKAISMEKENEEKQEPRKEEGEPK